MPAIARRILVILFIIIIVIVFVLLYIFVLPEELSLLQIISFYADISIALSMLIAVIQLSSGNTQHKENARRQAAEQAIAIAQYFQSDLIPKVSFVAQTFQYINLQEHELLKAYEREAKEVRFTTDEGQQVFHQENLQIYRTTLEAGVTTDILNAVERTVPVIKCDDIETFNAIRQNNLNTLEWICMQLTTGVADEKVIYQSLHQVFLHYVHLEYPLIAEFNHDNAASNQYYSHIIKIYNMWLQRSMKALAKEEAVNRHSLQKNRKRSVNLPRLG